MHILFDQLMLDIKQWTLKVLLVIQLKFFELKSDSAW